MHSQTQVSVVIPTFNAQRTIVELLQVLMIQTIIPNEIIIIDSSSTDETLRLISDFDIKIVTTIDRSTFNHASTRTLVSKKSKNDILIFLTQDAIPVNEFMIENITMHFSSNDGVI